MPQPTPLLSRTFDLPIGSLTLKPAYWHAGLIVILIFLLIISMAHLRHTYLKWSFKGILPAVFLGFLIAIFLEGLLIMNGRTIFVEVIGLENMPKPISTFLDESKGELVQVLGTTQSCEPQVTESNIKNTLDLYNNLPEEQKSTVQKAICE